MDSSTNIGFNDDMTSSHVVHVQLPEQIRSTEIEIVGEHGGVIHDIQYMGAILSDVKLNLELPEEGVPLVFVNGDLESISPGIEGTEWIILLDQTMQLGRGIESHFRVSLVDDGIGY